MVGAGFSKNASAGFPDWNQLGDIFYEKIHGKKPDDKNRYLNVLKLADEVKAALGRPELNQVLNVIRGMKRKHFGEGLTNLLLRYPLLQSNRRLTSDESLRLLILGNSMRKRFSHTGSFAFAKMREYCLGCLTFPLKQNLPREPCYGHISTQCSL